MQSTFVERTFPNRLRVVCEIMPRVSSAAVGFLVRTGSRHELPHQHGVSHFLEHMCFKGTPHRDWRQINVRFDELGSIYNAFTGKEHTVYYGWVPAARLPEQLELLSDMMRPSIPPEDYETERNVILEEIAMSGDSFEHHIFNFLHQSVFPNHPLAHEILGEKESIAKLPREEMLRYHAQRYAADNLCLLMAGALEPEKVFEAVARCCSTWQAANGSAAVPQPNGASPFTGPGVRKLKLEQFKQQSLVLVYPSVPHGDTRAESIEACTQLFGGHNSRCYWNIVQKGICLHAGAVWLSYGDCGVLALYADGQPERAEEMAAALRAEAEKVQADGYRPEEIQRVKNQRRTQLALEAESPRTRFMQLVDDLEVHGRPQGVDVRLAAVEAVTNDTIGAYLREFPITGEGLLLSIGPRDWP